MYRFIHTFIRFIYYILNNGLIGLFKIIVGVLALSTLVYSSESVETQQNQIQTETTPALLISSELNQRDHEKTIEIYGQRNRALSEVDEETKKLLQVPGINGDPLAAIYSLPGVVIAGGDYGGQPAIRGSSPDDNAYYIDFMPAGYIFHAFGPSIFNENLVQKFELLPAAFDAQYGEATGGIIDVSLRDPRNQALAGVFDWSLLQTGMMVESGLSDSQAFYLSYRKSLLHLFIEENEKDEDGLTFYEAPQSDDYQAKYQWLIGNNQRLTISANGASDYTRANIARESEMGRADPEFIGDIYYDENFDSKGLRWEHFGENGGYLSVAFSLLNDQELLTYGDGQYIDQTYQEQFFRGYYQRNWLSKQKLTMGVELRQFDFDYRFDIVPYFCTDHQQDCESQRGTQIRDAAKLKQTTQALYATNLWQFSDSWAFDFGARAEYNDYTKEHIFMPRAGLKWFVSNDLTINTKLGKYTRFPDAETAIRLLGNPQIRSPLANHFSIGADYQFSALWALKLDLYVKDMSRLPLALSDDDPDYDLHYVNQMSGQAKGIEILLERDKADDWYAWASLSWSQSERTNDRTGETKEYYLDTPLIFNLVANYQWHEAWNMGIRLTIRDGQKYTPIIGLRPNDSFEGHYLPVYGELNGNTLPLYHRLDIQAEYQFAMWGMDAALTFAVINALGHKNVEGYFFAPDGNESLDNFKVEEQEGIEMFPAIGFKLHF
ncbi:TonB-dependent receptor plug domain-containing protein [Aliikangiella maris]|uniref:TonB-dependent receptor n=2 Tax=Aliikangiella maris TaxID=3162458 RepID=A0ABV3MM84_9GAMM